MSNKYGRPSYVLTDAERRYITTGGTGSYRESQLEERVQRKVDRLGHRIHHLLADVRALEANGYLDAETWGDAWIGFIGFDEWRHTPPIVKRTMEDFVVKDADPNHADLIEACTHGPKPGRARPTTAPAAMARAIGRMVHHIMLTPEGVDGKQMMNGVVWGLIEGVYIDQQPPLGAEGRRELKEDLFEYLHQRLEQEVKEDAEWDDWWEEARAAEDDWDELRAELRHLIRDELYDAGVPIQPLHAEWLDGYNDEATEGGVYAQEVLDYLIDDVVDGPEDPDDLFVSDNIATMGQWNQFKREFGPIEEFDPREVVTRDRVLAIVAEHNLVAKGKLSIVAQEDAELVENTSWRGVDASDLLERVAERDDRPRSVDLAEDLEQRSFQSSVTKLGADLAGREFDRPILAGDNTGWELTAYGELVVKEMSGSAFTPFATGQDRGELIKQAMAEVGVEGGDLPRGH